MKIFKKGLSEIIQTNVDFVIDFPLMLIKGLLLLVFLSALASPFFYIMFWVFKILILFFLCFFMDEEPKAINIITVIVMAVFFLGIFLVNYFIKKKNEIKELKEGEASVFIYWRPCPSCSGEGCVYVKTDDYGNYITEICDQCNGKREHPSGKLTLKGSKRFSSGLKYLAECPKCEGSGSIFNIKGKKIRCKTCHGKGKVYSTKSDEIV